MDHYQKHNRQKKEWSLCQVMISPVQRSVTYRKAELFDGYFYEKCSQSIGAKKWTKKDSIQRTEWRRANYQQTKKSIWLIRNMLVKVQLSSCVDLDRMMCCRGCIYRVDNLRGYTDDSPNEYRGSLHMDSRFWLTYRGKLVSISNLVFLVDSETILLYVCTM